MKTTNFFKKAAFGVAVCTSAFLFTQCNTETRTENAAEETEDAIENTASNIEQERKELAQEIETKIDNLETRMEGIDDEQVEAQIQENVDELKSELSKVQEATEDNWEEVKASTRNYFNEIDSELEGILDDNS